jgi:hypothetical protein
VQSKRKTAPPPANLNDTGDAPEVSEMGEMGKHYVSNVTFEFGSKDSQVPLYQRVSALLSRLKTENANLQILPDTLHETLNPITEGKHIPFDSKNFGKYFTNMVISKFTIKFFTRVQSHKRINELKCNRQIFDYLQQHRI